MIRLNGEKVELLLQQEIVILKILVIYTTQFLLEN